MTENRTTFVTPKPRDETSYPTIDTSGAQKSLHRFTRSRKRPSLIECSGCSNGWTGLTACHCSGCHRTFTGLRAFDIHRVGGQCNDPAGILDKSGEPRLVPVDKPYWSGWAIPGDDDRWGNPSGAEHELAFYGGAS